MKQLAGLVSVIIPVYNRSKLIIDAVESVFNQDYPDTECIIINDGSTDDTPETLNALVARYPGRVRVIHRGNSGPGPSREQGRLAARGEFIQYLDSDDLLAPTKFTDQVTALRFSPKAALCYGITEYYRIGKEGNRTVFANTDQPIDRIFPASLRSRRWGTSTPLYRRSVTDRIGPWGAMWSEEDWEYDCRIGALGQPIAYLDRMVSFQRGLVGQRLSQQGRDDPRTLASQAQARTHILAHALKAGVSPEQPEMEHFLRSLFMLARDSGGAGLAAEADRLCGLVTNNANRPQLRRSAAMYRALASALGWGWMSRMARLVERGRSLVN